MRKITQEELDIIIEQHQHWLNEDCNGWEDMKADLSGCDMSGLNLNRANMARANMEGANMEGANMEGANMAWANMEGANMARANMEGANMARANMEGAKRKRLGRVISEPITGYKKTREGVVITAEIPAGAIVFCINGRKCRANKAKIIDMAGHEVLHSQYDNGFEYRLGQEIVIEDFNLMYNVECASGFHFFEDKKDAENY